MLWYISLLRQVASLQRVQKGNTRTMSEALNKRRQKLQITQSVCNYANALLTTWMLSTLKGAFVR